MYINGNRDQDIQRNFQTVCGQQRNDIQFSVQPDDANRGYHSPVADIRYHPAGNRNRARDLCVSLQGIVLGTCLRGSLIEKNIERLR
jgi:hypothetical protein